MEWRNGKIRMEIEMVIENVMEMEIENGMEKWK